MPFHPSYGFEFCSCDGYRTGAGRSGGGGTDSSDVGFSRLGPIELFVLPREWIFDRFDVGEDCDALDRLPDFALDLFQEVVAALYGPASRHLDVNGNEIAGSRLAGAKGVVADPFRSVTVQD